MISRNKKFGFRQTLIGAGALLIVGTIGFTTYADGSVETEVETKVNNKVVESIKQNDENEDKVEAVITMDSETGEVFNIQNCEELFEFEEKIIEDTNCDEIKGKGGVTVKQGGVVETKEIIDNEKNPKGEK